ncbi:PREDICTED: uncharacterized protein LOC109161656 [Ipomoea nil]|uniref:uncharacterized protein LOC109161656 n=1 Tax=Ipomoea nil TaxID=35883 RepID=UPI000900D356|nr:PREDICTED: uncharacterized protein LOC109161656 [Ipomoea nil]
MGSDSSRVTHLLAELASEFKIRDMGAPSFFLCIETVTWNGSLLLSQQQYMQDILKRAGMTDLSLKRAGMTDCKPLVTPVCLSWTSTTHVTPYEDPTQYQSLVGTLQYLTVTRPDLSCVSTCTRPLLSIGLCSNACYGTSTGFNILAYMFVRPLHFMCMPFRIRIGLKQRTMARSSTEAEYKALTDVSAEKK